MNRILEKVIYRLKGFYPVKIGEQTFKVDPSHLFFWRIVNDGSFEPAFFNMLDQYLSKDSVYCDIGAWIGPTAMYAARLCKTVHAFEPDAIACKFLRQNIEENHFDNILVHNLAISIKNEMVKMASHGGKPGDSMSSMVNIDQYKQSFRAKAISWKTFLEAYKPGKIDFIKMDIEGGEFELIPSMRSYLEKNKPLLHLSLHPAYLHEQEKDRKLNSIFSDLKFYNHILDEDLNKVNPNDYLSSGSANSDFRAFLFVP